MSCGNQTLNLNTHSCNGITLTKSEPPQEIVDRIADYIRRIDSRGSRPWPDLSEMQREEWRIYARNILAICSFHPPTPWEALLQTIARGLEAADRELTDYAKFLAVRGGAPTHWPVKEIVDAHEAIKDYRAGRAVTAELVK
jgi:hypothetical protein